MLAVCFIINNVQQLLLILTQGAKKMDFPGCPSGKLESFYASLLLIIFIWAPLFAYSNI